jgi:uncharacterized protein (DUF427 family)
MSLTFGSGPIASNPTGDLNFPMADAPKHRILFEDYPRRMRAFVGERMVLDSVRGKLLHESNILPVYYAPIEDFAEDLLSPADHSTHCPFKGDASYRSVRVGERVAENAVWHYPEPIDSAPEILGLAAVYSTAMDEWYEEDELVFGHLRDPYHRVDVRESSRRVRVRVNGALVADTERPRLLFETGVPLRYYIPTEDVRTDLLTPSDTHTTCPYKGTASYWSVESPGGEPVADAAFGYTEPLPESQAVAGLVCFTGPSVEIEDELVAAPAGAGAG